MQNFRADNENLLREDREDPPSGARFGNSKECIPMDTRGLPVYERMHLRYTKIIIVLTSPVNAPDHRALRATIYLPPRE